VERPMNLGRTSSGVRGSGFALVCRAQKMPGSRNSTFHCALRSISLPALPAVWGCPL